MQTDDGRYILYDHGAYLDLLDDDHWLASLADAFGLRDAGELTDSAKWDQLYIEETSDLDDEIRAISERFQERVGELRPEWGGSYELMAKGTAARWDVRASAGRAYYRDGESSRGDREAAFSALCSDTGYDGVFKDCEIDGIWEDREGTVHVRGVHHDGEVVVAVRAVEPGTEAEEGNSRLIEQRWRDGVTADMTGLYGYRWPERRRTEAPAPSELAARARASASRPDARDAGGRSPKL